MQYLPIKDAVKRVPSVRLLVNLQVLLEIGAGGKLLLTVIALEGLLARVNSLVSDQVGDLRAAKKYGSVINSGIWKIRYLRSG